jgi:uncharacterized protein YaaN involved in tellurite resistance
MSDELMVITPQMVSTEVQTLSSAVEPDKQLVMQADSIVEKILSIEPRDLLAQEKQAAAITNLGQPIEAALARRSQMLKEPMLTLMKDAEDGGQVAKDLLSLQEQVGKINPNRVNFDTSSLRRILAMIPGVGTPLSRWFAQYQSVDSVIQDIVASLQEGRKSLENDNVTLSNDQRSMRELTFSLTDYIALGQLLDQKLAQAVENATAIDEPRHKFLEEEILFPLRQRLIDLQQRLAVCQQGILAVEVIIRNNKELVKGVKRATDVTVMALNTAATLQIALQRQKRVLEGVQAVTDTTNDLLVGTSEQLKTQGVAIQKQASQAQLDITKLKQAFANTAEALDDISAFRRNALPQMAQSIVEMDELNGRMAEAIEKMEEGNRVADEFNIELLGMMASAGKSA